MVTLGIATSSGQFAFTLEENSNILFISEYLQLSEDTDIRFLILDSLKNINKSTNELSNIIIDKGPGGTSKIRTGVAFANSLAYSLNISVIPVSSLELAGIEAWENYKLPVICIINSINGNTFVGFFNNNKLWSIKYGKIDQILPPLVKNIEEFVIVGNNQEHLIKNLIPNKKVHHSNIFYGNVETLIKKRKYFSDRALSYPDLVKPITEQNI